MAKKKNFVTIDGNYAAAYIAYAFSEIAAIYPITPSSTMGEYADGWSAKGKKNIFDQVVKVVEMQSEGGAAGAVHGSLTAGSLTTTFTASQGLLLMIPNMYKIAGEMLPAVFHVSARSLATHALSIFNDHSDVMSCRMTGWAMTAASSIQETMDMAVVAHLSTLEARLPFLAFFDGFRTSHEIQKVELISHDTLKELVSVNDIRAFRDNALRPEQPYIKVGAQNPDVYFQGRERANKYYDAIPEIVQKNMDRLAKETGRQYHLFDYYGAKDATKIIIMMGSATNAVIDTLEYMANKGEKVGVVNVHLYRPFSIKHFLSAIPKSVKKIAVLDRTKEPGAVGEPLYMDVKSVVDQSIEVYGGRYGLSSKEFTPREVVAVYDFLDSKDVHHNFTVGINDDVTHLSIPRGEMIDVDPEHMTSCKFWGLGSDGTVSANKNSIKIIGDYTDMYAQGYFFYDSKKSGGITISHLRFGKDPIGAPYLVTLPNFVACHNPSYIGRYDLLEGIKQNGTFLLNSDWTKEEVFENLTLEMQKTIIEKNIRVFNIDALKIAKEVGLRTKISTIMQAAFFKVADVIPIDDAVKYMKGKIETTFLRKGRAIVDMNWSAVDTALSSLMEIEVPKTIVKSAPEMEVLVGEKTDWVKNVVEPIVRLKGDDIPVSLMTEDGRMPLGITRMEKRRISADVVTWVSDACIQCNQCVIACPHAAIRAKQIDTEDLKSAPSSFSVLDIRKSDLKYKIQVYTEDCTGCGICVEVCPGKKNVKALEFSPLELEIEKGEIDNATFFDALPENLEGVKMNAKGTQFMTPLFEFSGACPGCGETPYIKLATQLFGDRMVIANATGCSSIYGGTFPSSPYTTNEDGHGPAWANSLFEDNAEYGMGMRIAMDQNRELLRINLDKALKFDELRSEFKVAAQKMISMWDKVDVEAKQANKVVKAALPKAFDDAKGELKGLLYKIDELKDYFLEKSMWIIGGDGWAYDIGYGGLDHVLASGENVNILVVDTEVYSNTGGQASKASQMGAIAKFAANGKERVKKDMGMIAMSYGYVYVANVNMGANQNQVVKAFTEAESYDGPSIIFAYSPCIAHGYNMKDSPAHQAAATDTGYWPIYRFDPRLAEKGKNPLVVDKKKLKGNFNDHLLSENRYKALNVANPERAKVLFDGNKNTAVHRFNQLLELSKLSYKKDEDKE